MNSSIRIRTWLGAIVLSSVPCCAAVAEAESFDIVARQCRDASPAIEKIRRCERLISENKLDDAWKSWPYLEIATAYSALHENNRAIEYAKKYAVRIEDYYKRNTASVRCRGMSGNMLHLCTVSSSAAVSLAYQWVARYETLSALDLMIAAKIEESAVVAKSAIANLSRAISINPDSSSAYAERAALFARFCRASEAEADYLMAIRLALARSQDQEARNYRDKVTFISSECQQEYRGYR